MLVVDWITFDRAHPTDPLRGLAVAVISFPFGIAIGGGVGFVIGCSERARAALSWLHRERFNRLTATAGRRFAVAFVFALTAVMACFVISWLAVGYHAMDLSYALTVHLGLGILVGGIAGGLFAAIGGSNRPADHE
jgi:hypothetical protein